MITQAVLSFMLLAPQSSSVSFIPLDPLKEEHKKLKNMPLAGNL
jgi:hypothetical protein